MNAKQFLRLVLPRSGYYCLARPFTTSDGHNVFKHYTTDNVDDLVVTARTWDGHGHDVYYAMGSLKEPRVYDPQKADGKGGYRYRTKANMNLLRTVFLELDVLRPHEVETASDEERNRKYTDRAEALADTKRFCKDLGWPLPMVVDSGWGFHLYWLLTEEIEPKRYEVLGKKLKLAAKKLSYKLDPACTDMSRVFRVVGTHNQKDAMNPQRVSVKATPSARVAFDTLEEAVDTYLEEHNVPTGAIVERHHLPDYLNFGASNTSDYPDEPLDLQRIQSKCGAIQEFIEAGANVDYHFWMHSLQLIRHCEGGRELCHEISAQAPSYDPDTTDKVLNSFEEKDIPPTLCDTMAGSSDACESCPHRSRIRSPASLGREVSSYRDNAALAMQAAVGKMPDPPWPFKVDAQRGVYAETEDDDGVPQIEDIYDYEINPVKRVFSEREQKEVTLWHTYNPADGYVEIEMPASALYDKRTFQSVLADCGVYPAISKVDRLRTYMVSYVQEVQKVYTKEMLYSRMGWRDEQNRFIYAGHVYQQGQLQRCEMERGGRVVEAVRSAGTLDGWKDIMSYFEGDDFAAHQFAFGTAFGSILMPFTGLSGAIINIVGESGEGKSTVQKLVNSVWGHPTDLMLPAEARSSTYNAKISFINQMNNLPICAEEITNASAEEMGSLAYAITQGSEKWRADIRGSIRESQGGWCTTMLASSNTSMHEKLHAAEGAGAKALRVFEYRMYHVHRHSKTEFRQGVDLALTEHYGHAGDLYLRYVVENKDSVRERLRQKMAAIDATYQMAPEERVWSAAIATNLIGLEIAQELGLHNFNIPMIEQFLHTELAKMRGTVQDMASTPVEQLSRFLSENVRNMLVVETQGQNVFVVHRPSGSLHIRYDTAKNELAVSASALRQWARDSGVGYNKMVNEMAEQGIVLSRSRRITLGAGAEIPTGQVRSIVVDAQCPAFSGALQSVKSIQPNVPNAQQGK